MGAGMTRRRRFSSFQIILAGFLLLILAGTTLLMLPVSSAGNSPAVFSDALFTSASAVCVTGLAVLDTGTAWSQFGQTVILALIQIGGLGVVTAAAYIFLKTGRRITLKQLDVMQEAASAPQLGGMVRLEIMIIRLVFLTELAGALLMMPVFCRDFGARGIWFACFHSVSAFCNAGFDIMGAAGQPMSSLQFYASDPLILLVLMALIIAGGLGFLTWKDILAKKLRFREYSFQSRIILSVCVFLILVPAVVFFILDFADLPLKERLLSSLFQAVVPRTAGFSSVDLNSMNDSGRLILIILMMIGGAPGSTAGGIKITTFAALAACMAATARRRRDVELFGRRLNEKTVRTAGTVLMLYSAFCGIGAMVISTIERLPLDACLFETVSAAGTVGLSMGITTQLGFFSRCILMCLMVFGRVGGLSLVYALVSEKRREISRLPAGELMIG